MNRARQPGIAVWLTGLPASGKSTLARALQDLLAARGIPSQLLDSDELRRILTPSPSYSRQERAWFYQVLTYIGGLLTDNGVHVLIAATASRRAYRTQARQRIPRFAEVYVRCPAEICRQRDPKGLWKRAESGELDALPGMGEPYQAPEQPEICIDTHDQSVASAASQILDELIRMGYLLAVSPDLK